MPSDYKTKKILDYKLVSVDIISGDSQYWKRARASGHIPCDKPGEILLNAATLKNYGYWK